MYKYIILISLFYFVSCKDVVNQQKKQYKVNNEENLIRANKGLLKIDVERIESYVKRRNWNMQKTQTGLWFGVYSGNSNAQAKEGDIVTIKYKIELLDGTLCYSSDSTGAKSFKLGQGGVENGLEQGLLLMKEGEKAHFIMPPYMAHGLIGDQDKIPARSIIVYDVELIKIEKNK